MTNKNDQLVVGVYANTEAAKDAASAIKEWDHKDNDVKLGAMAVITYDHKKDELHYDEIGQRSTKTGAGWGTAIGATIGILTGGVGLIPGMAVGAAAGGGDHPVEPERQVGRQHLCRHGRANLGRRRSYGRFGGARPGHSSSQ